MQIAKYFATFGIKIDQKSLDRITTILKKLEDQAKKYHGKIDNLDNKTAANKVKNIDSVAKYQNKKMDNHVYQYKNHLNKLAKADEVALKRKAQAISRVERAVRYYSPPSVKKGMAPSSASHSGMMGAYQARTAQERLGASMFKDSERAYTSRLSASAKARAAQERLGASMAGQYEKNYQSRIRQEAIDAHNNKFTTKAGRAIGGAWDTLGRAGSTFRNTGRNAFMVTGIAGSLGYLMNTVTDKATSNEAAWVKLKNSIISKGGTEKEAKERYLDMIAYSKKIGINYLPVMGDYARTISSSVGIKGTSTQQATDIFKSFLDVSAVYGLPASTTNMLMKGVTQSLGKEQLMAEEYRGQIIEHASIGDDYKSAYFSMLKDKTGEVVAEGDRNIRFNADMKAGKVDTIALSPYLMKVFNQKYTPLLADASKNLSWSVNNFSNALNDAFNPLTNKKNAADLKEGWNNLTASVKTLAPALLRLAVFVSKNFSKIIEKLGSWFGIDVEEQERETALAIGAHRDMKAGVDITPVYDTVQMGGVVGGSTKLLRSGNPAKYDAYQNMLQEFIDINKYDYLDPGAGSDKVDALKRNPSGKVREDFNRHMDTISGSASSAEKTVKQKAKGGGGMLINGSGGQNVTIQNIEITTRDANTLPSDLMASLAQFRGLERPA